MKAKCRIWRYGRARRREGKPVDVVSDVFDVSDAREKQSPWTGGVQEGSKGRGRGSAMDRNGDGDMEEGDGERGRTGKGFGWDDGSLEEEDGERIGDGGGERGRGEGGEKMEEEGSVW